MLLLGAGPSGVQVFAEGSPVASLSFGAGGNSNASYFGAASILASAELTELEWVTIVPSAASCLADFNCDIVVDDMDSLIFVQAYNLLVCDDPAMPAGRAADLNADGFVDDSDFVSFVAAYNALLCP